MFGQTVRNGMLSEKKDVDMKESANFEEILTGLSAALECGPLRPDERGRVLFGLDEDMGATLFMEEDEDSGLSALVACVIIGRPDSGDAELLHDLLCANYMWSASGDGTLAVNRESGLLVVHRMMELPMAPSAFVDLFSSLVGAARYWRSRLKPEAERAELSGNVGILRV